MALLIEHIDKELQIMALKDSAVTERDSDALAEGYKTVRI